MTETGARRRDTAATADGPYVGLVAYSEADADFFFGREEEAEIIAANLKVSRLTLLYGPSGVGKSSVLFAGVVPHLREQAGAEVDGKPDFAVAVHRSWRRDPLKGLADSIHAAVTDSVGEPLESWSASAPLIDTLNRWTERVGTILVVLDQFEEYFLYYPEVSDGHVSGPETFDAVFPQIVNDQSLRVNFLVSIRDDAWTKLDRFEDTIPHLFGNALRVDYLDFLAARRAIDGPIEKYNEALSPAERFSIDRDLREAVIEQVKTGRIMLAETRASPADELPTHDSARIEAPFLQLVMRRLWRATVDQDSRRLRQQTLDQLGGAERIVTGYLADTIGGLQPEEQEIVAEVSRFLVTPSKTKIAQRSSDLAFWTGRTEAELDGVLRRLSQEEGGRILRRLPPPAGESVDSYEIFHDVLAEPIIAWRRKYERAREQEAAAARLSRFRKRVIRWAVVGLVVLAALAALTVWALRQRSSARDARKSVESQLFAQRALAALETDPAQSVRLAAEGVRTRATDQAEQALRAALAGSHVRSILRANGPVSDAAFSPDGKLIVTSNRDGTANVWDTSSGRNRTVLGGHARRVASADFSPDGTLIVTASADGTARVWQTGSGRLVRVLRGHRGTVNSAVFAPDGTRIVTAGNDGTARVWQVESGRAVRVLRDDAGDVNGASFSSDGKLVLAFSEDGNARIWRTASGRLLGTLAGHSGPLESAEFNSDGTLVVTGSDDGTARVWLLGTDRSVVLGGHSGAVRARFSSDGKRVVTAGADGTARVYDARSGRELALLRGHTGPVEAASFSPNGTRVVTASADGTVRIWTSKGAPVFVLRGHTGSVADASFDPSGRLVVSASADKTSRVWDVSGGRIVARLRPPTKAGLTIASFSPDGARAVTADTDGHVDLWDAARAELLENLRRHNGVVFVARFSPDGKRLLTASADETARIWNAIDGHVVHVLAPSAGPVLAAAFSADGKRVVTGGTNGTAWIWNAESGEPLRPLRAPGGPVLAASFNRDGSLVLTGSEDGNARLWDASNTRLPRVLRGDGSKITAASFSPDGARIVTANGNGAAVIWDAATGHVLQRLVGHRGPIFAAAFSPDGKRVVTAGYDASVRVWDAETGEPLPPLRGHEKSVVALAFSPDSKLIVSAGTDRTVRVWEAATGRSLAVVRGATGPVRTVSFSPDGRELLTAGDDGTARIVACDFCGSIEQLLERADRVSRPD